MNVLDVIAIFIFLSGLFIFINTFFLKLPSSIGLMILALGLSLGVLLFGNLYPEFHLAEQVKNYDFTEVLYRFVISVMLFAGALNVNFSKMGKQLWPILVLTFFGLTISTITIGALVYGMVLLLDIQLPFLVCLVFGALISSTDPIAITKAIRRFHLPEALETKVTNESLLSGSLSIVLALTLMNIQETHMMQGFVSVSDISIIIVRDLLGGLIVGVLFGWLGFTLLDFVDNDVVEAEVLITMALVLVGSYLADLLAVSSFLVAILTGLIIGNFGRKKEGGQAAVGSYVYKFWKLMEETMAAMLFVLIGFEMLVIPLRLDYFAGGFFAVLLVMFSRWLSIFIPVRLMSLHRSFDDDTVTVLTWGALRGGLPVAFTLSLADFPGKDAVVTFTYVVVVCSVLYQGLSLGTLMKIVQRKYDTQRDPKITHNLEENSQITRSAA